MEPLSPGRWARRRGTRRGSSLLAVPVGQHSAGAAPRRVALLQWSRQLHQGAREEDCIPRKRPRSGRRNGEDGRGTNGTAGSQSVRRSTHVTTPAQERAYLVGLDYGQRATMGPRESLRELARLARTAGATVVGQTLQRRKRPEPATYIGAGKLEEIIGLREETDYSVVIFDEQLSPGQQLRLESALEVKVLDRSALILDIFASRASTREAALQVDLAQHEYLLPRLRGQWQHLERLEGAIGSRGPGETQLETDRRLIGGRISRLKKQIGGVRRQRELHRSRRRREGIPVVALVGYTNAGKSSLLQSLAGSDTLTADALFATLDPLTRRVGTDDAETFLLTDTVGFIQKLPTQLISAFRATLEELESADVLLHVVDTTSEAASAQSETVLETLAALGIAGTPMLTVLNKADDLALPDGSSPTCEADLARIAIDNPARDAAEAHPDLPNLGTVLVSALTGWGIAELRTRLGYELFGKGLAAPAPSRVLTI